MPSGNTFCFTTLPRLDIDIENITQEYIDILIESFRNIVTNLPANKSGQRAGLASVVCGVIAPHDGQRGDVDEDDERPHAHLFVRTLNPVNWASAKVRRIMQDWRDEHPEITGVNLSDKSYGRSSTKSICQYMLKHLSEKCVWIRKDVIEESIDSVDKHVTLENVHTQRVEEYMELDSSYERKIYLAKYRRSVQQDILSSVALLRSTSSILSRELELNPFSGFKHDKTIYLDPSQPGVLPWLIVLRWIKYEMLYRRPFSAQRSQWPHLYLYGAPGIGKSYMFQELLGYLCPLWKAGARSENFSGFDSSYHRFMLFDEYNGSFMAHSNMLQLMSISTQGLSVDVKCQDTILIDRPVSCIFVSNEKYRPRTQVKAWDDRLISVEVNVPFFELMAPFIEEGDDEYNLLYVFRNLVYNSDLVFDFPRDVRVLVQKMKEEKIAMQREDYDSDSYIRFQDLYDTSAELSDLE
jgi:hypothetical protein